MSVKRLRSSGNISWHSVASEDVGEIVRPANIIVFCPILRNNMQDRPLIQAAVALEDYGHKVTLLTAAVRFDLRDDGKLKLPIRIVGSLIPFTICGFFKKPLYFLKSLALSWWCYFKKPDANPGIILYNESHYAIRLLRRFTRFRLVQFQAYHKQIFTVDAAKNLLKVMDLSCAHDILLPTDVGVRYAYRGAGMCNIEMHTLYPAVDTGSFRSANILHKKIILPEIPKHCKYFLVYGVYCATSNFRLALHAYHTLRQFLGFENRKRVYLVFAGADAGDYEPDSYSFLKGKTKRLEYKNNLIFRRNINTVDRKSLIYHSVAVLLLHPDIVYERLYFEVMALGKPIISLQANMFAAEILEHRATGYLTPMNPIYIANVMRMLLVRTLYRKLVGELAANQFNQKYSYAAFAYNLDIIMRSEFRKTQERAPEYELDSELCQPDNKTEQEETIDENKALECISNTSLVSVVTDKTAVSETEGEPVEDDVSDEIDDFVLAVYQTQHAQTEGLQQLRDEGLELEPVEIEDREYSRLIYVTDGGQVLIADGGPGGNPYNSFERCLYPNGPGRIIKKYLLILQQRKITMQVKPKTDVLDNLPEEE